MFTFVLQKLRESWKKSDFQLDHAALLEELPKILDEIEPEKLKSPKRQKLDKRKSTSKENL